MLLLPGWLIAPAIVRSRPSPVLLSPSRMLCGPSLPKTVTALTSASRPRATWNGAHGFASAFSAKQEANLAGVPCVALSPRPGCAPPMLSSTSRIARPIEAFAGKAGPKQPLPEWMPSSLAIGPLTTIVSATGCVVAFSPATLCASSRIACTAASTTGKTRGSQPAIAALAATPSTVTSP